MEDTDDRPYGPWYDAVDRCLTLGYRLSVRHMPHGAPDVYALSRGEDEEYRQVWRGATMAGAVAAAERGESILQPHQLKSLFPYAGGKSRVAADVHARMGRVANRVEPFAGTAVWTLSAPADGATETINDADGFISNCYRAIRADADAVAGYVDWPVSEVDLHARHRWLVDRRDGLEHRLRDDPDHYDAQMAGWWLWGICQWIGDGWCPRPGEHGRTVDDDLWQQSPHLGDAGMGVHRASDAHPLTEQLPHLGDAGRGVHRLLRAYSERLRRVRIACGDWRRVLGPSVTERHGITAIFLDPPYPDTAMGYAGGPADVWHEAHQWAVEHGNNPMLRIALCGYDAPGLVFPDGWRTLRWKARGGYGSQGQGKGRANANRETIWFSPHCLDSVEDAKTALFRPLTVKVSANLGPMFDDAA